MPCKDPDADVEYAREAAQEINKLTDMLCRALRMLEKRVKRLPDDISDWWKAHQANDLLRQEDERRRRRDEQTRQQALRRLSPREQKLLGIRQKGS